VTLTTGNNPVAGMLEIRLVNLNQIDPTAPLADLEVDFDHVRLDASPAAVPEPGGFVVAGLAMLLSLARRRRTRANRQDG